MAYRSDLSALQLAVLTICLIVTAWFVATYWIYVTCTAIIYACIFRRSCGTIPVHGQGVLVTGCDTGFGHHLAKRLDRLGFTVFAGCLKPGGEGAKQLISSSSNSLHVLSLDVGSDDSVRAAHDYIVENLPTTGLWGVVNNAGFNVNGDVELLTADLYNKAMNVNFYGMTRTIQQCLHLVRQTKGRIVNVSSVRGVISWPHDSPYQASKASVEIMTDALRLEMQKFGVHVSKILPGNFSKATASRRPEIFVRFRQEIEEMWNNASTDVKEIYGKAYMVERLNIIETSDPKGATDSKPVIDAMVDALISVHPQPVYLVDGGEGWLDKRATLARYQRYLPTWLADMIVYTMTGCQKFPDYAVVQKDRNSKDE